MTDDQEQRLLRSRRDWLSAKINYPYLWSEDLDMVRGWSNEQIRLRGTEFFDRELAQAYRDMADWAVMQWIEQDFKDPDI